MRVRQEDTRYFIENFRPEFCKIDVEGYENKILSSITRENLSRIDRIYAETEDSQEILGFSSESYGGLTRYYRI